MTDSIKTLLACFPLLSSQRRPFGRVIVSSSSSGELSNMEWSGNQFDKHQNLDTNIAEIKKNNNIYILELTDKFGLHVRFIKKGSYENIEEF